MRTWWKASGEVALKLAALAGSMASLIAPLLLFLPSPKDLSWWAIALLFVAPLLLVAFGVPVPR